MTKLMKIYFYFWMFFILYCICTKASSGEVIPLPHVHIPKTSITKKPLPTILRDSQGNSDLFIARNLSRDRGHTVDDSGDPVRPFLTPTKPVNGEYFPYSVHSVFDESAPKEVSTFAGRAASLHCIVQDYGNYSVSWIKQSNLHILTSGQYIYTTDNRYKVIHSNDSDDWILKISYAQERDSGIYECQVSTKPIQSYLVQLKVFKAPKSTIIGSPDMYVDKGSTINITCVVSDTPLPPETIKWTHNNLELQYDSPRGGITMLTERRNTTTGYLLLKEATPADSGNYTCIPSCSLPSSLRVHILDGEMPAAMQTNKSSISKPSQSNSLTLFSIVMSFILSV